MKINIVSKNEVKDLKTPFFLISKKVILDQYSYLKKFADIISYSSKTNSMIGKILEEETTNLLFSIHLKEELENISEMSRVIFLAQGWNKDFILYLYKLGIRWFVVDNEKDLEIFYTFLSENSFIKNNSINLLLRLKLKEYSLKTEKFFIFGMYSKVVEKWILKIYENNAVYNKLNNLGIHFHRKTQNLNEWDYIFDLKVLFSDKVFKIINILNIGGGLPSYYVNTNKKDFNFIFKKIFKLKEFCNNKSIKLMIEPGRFIAAPAGKLYTSILSVYDDVIIVDASVYNGDLDALIVPVKLLVEGEKSLRELSFHKRKELKYYTIKGITPCSMDIFRYKVYFDDISFLENKKLIFLNAGAYNFSSDFCNLKPYRSYLLKEE